MSADPIAEARERQRIVNAYHRTLGSEDGAQVLADLKAAFGFDAPAFVRGASGAYDPIHAAVRDGQRQIILHIQAMLARAALADALVDAPDVTVETGSDL